MKLNFYIFLFIISVLSGCEKTANDNPYHEGNLRILVDESFQPITESESKAFVHFHNKANPNIKVVAEDKAFKELLSDSVDVIISSRTLSKEEEEKFSRKNLFPQQYIIGSDALVFLISPQRKDSFLTHQNIKDIVNGKLTNWKDVGSDDGEIQLVINQRGSSDLRHLLDTLNVESPGKIYVAGSTEKVAEYVNAHPNSIGIIGLSWISDEPKTSEILKKTKVLLVADDKGNKYHPFQENLALQNYPFRRNIIFINKYQTGLGTGFASFILGDEGQRLMLKFGLLPAKMPGREVIINY